MRKTNQSASPDGTSALLLHLSGTLPVNFRGNTYRFPLSIWIPHAYPREPPMIYVTPTQTMVIRAGQHVDPQGQVYHPYLVGWQQFWDVRDLDVMRTCGLVGKWLIIDAEIHITRFSCDSRRRLCKRTTRRRATAGTTDPSARQRRNTAADSSSACRDDGSANTAIARTRIKATSTTKVTSRFCVVFRAASTSTSTYFPPVIRAKVITI